MSFEKPSLYRAFVTSGDIRVLMDLMNTYKYTDEDVSEVINCYEPYDNDFIPEVEHIETLLAYFPNSTVSNNTMKAIQTSFPNRAGYILQLTSRNQPN